jgi:hypothetical protein
MAIDTTSPRTRRAILMGTLGGVAASVAATLARASRVDADNGNTVLIGNTYTATRITTIDATGSQALRATSKDRIGASALSGSSYGFHGESDSRSGVRGSSRAIDRPAILGDSTGDSTGVLGYSGSNGAAMMGMAKTGVYGYAVQDSDARGVIGESTVGRGVFGLATSGTGVFGVATGGDGVHGESSGSNGVSGSTSSGIASGVFGQNTSSGYGIAGTCHGGVGVSGFSNNGIAVAARSDSGVALQAQGKVTFSTSGLAAIVVGSRSKSVRTGSDLVASSRILCTLESNQPGLSIQHLTKDTTADTFTVSLSAAVLDGKYAKVAWFVIG